MSSVKIGQSHHGKGRVRVVKVIKKPDGTNHIQQLNVQLLIEGWDMDTAFTEGDNSLVVPTDTCKNTVYCLAAENDFASIEDFAMIICKHFFKQYPDIVNKISVYITSDNWVRLVLPDSKGKVVPHKHAFQRIGPKKDYVSMQASKATKSSPIKFTAESGFKELEVLKTTMSGFVDFHRCRYTSLPDVSERLVGTSVTCYWSWSQAALAGRTNFNDARAKIEHNIIYEFAGPSDKGVYSPSVQKTLYDMGKAAVEKVNAIDRLTLEMPNIHNIPFNLETYGISNKDHTGHPFIFFPIDEPHGMIRACIERNNSKF